MMCHKHIYAVLTCWAELKTVLCKSWMERHYRMFCTCFQGKYTKTEFKFKIFFLSEVSENDIDKMNVTDGKTEN